MAVSFVPLTVACPTCESTKVFYTCTPDCCFNHLCEACRTTFELATTAAGGEVPAAERDGLSDAAPDDTTALHARCAACDSLAVRLAETGDVAACGTCYARLELQVENVRPDGVA